MVQYSQLEIERTPSIATSMCPPRIMENDSLESKPVSQRNQQDRLQIANHQKLKLLVKV
jgi:hypothetical protein